MEMGAYTFETAVSVFWSISMRYCGIYTFFCAVLRFSDPLTPPSSRCHSFLVASLVLSDAALDCSLYSFISSAQLLRKHTSASHRILTSGNDDKRPVET